MMTDDWRSIVRRYRVRHGLSQAAFAVLMDVSQRTVSRWERGEDSPGLEARKRLRDLGLEPPEILLRNLSASIKYCPAPRALSATSRLRLVAVSRPAMAKRPSISEWIGRDLIEIAAGVLEEMLDDRNLQRAIRKKEVIGLVSTTRSVLDTAESPRIGTYQTTVSYFFHDGTLYSDAISVPAPPSEACGYRAFSSDDAWLAPRPSSPQ